MKHDPDYVDAIKREFLEGDEETANIIADQDRRCATILKAYVGGQAFYREYFNVVAKFLQAAATEGALGSGYNRPSSESLWHQLEQLSWSKHGDPQISEK